MDTEISPEQLETNIDDAMSDDGIEAVDVTEKGYKFAPVEVIQQGKVQKRKVAVPQNRFTPLKQAWHQIYKPIVTHMGLEIRMNTKAKAIELRTCSSTKDVGALEKATEYIKAFLVGFELEDAEALLRLEDLYIESFSVDDVKTLHGDNLSRAIGRIAGKDGKTKFTIENATRTRIVLADKKIHILGSFQNIKIARDAVCDLIMGSPPGKITAKLRTVSARLREKF